MNSILAFAGRQGPLLLFFGVVIGFVFPALAATAKPWMGAAVFVFTLGAFLRVDRNDFRAELRRPQRAVAVLAWTLAGVPALAWVLVHVVSVPAEIGLAIMLCMLAPPVGSAAAMAAMLGLNAALALAATIVVSVLAPLYLPPIAALIGGSAEHIDAVAMLGRIVAVIGAAAGTAVLLRRFAGAFVVRNPSAMTGVSVVGLLRSRSVPCTASRSTCSVTACRRCN
jgi:BASS family bile acid:Na+ symporter